MDCSNLRITNANSSSAAAAASSSTSTGRRKSMGGGGGGGNNVGGVVLPKVIPDKHSKQRKSNWEVVDKLATGMSFSTICSNELFLNPVQMYEI